MKASRLQPILKCQWVKLLPPVSDIPRRVMPRARHKLAVSEAAAGSNKACRRQWLLVASNQILLCTAIVPNASRWADTPEEIIMLDKSKQIINTVRERLGNQLYYNPIEFFEMCAKVQAELESAQQQNAADGAYCACQEETPKGGYFCIVCNRPSPPCRRLVGA